MNVIWLDTIDSTNSEALRRLVDVPSGTVIAAREQTAGRGQRGNTWFTQPGQNLTFSIVLKFADAFPAARAVALNYLSSLAVAQFLQGHDNVAWVQYCGLPGDKYYELGQKYLPNGSCGVMAFAVKGGRDTAVKFMDSLRLMTIATHVADARTCLLHPASHTHRQLTEEQLLEAGVAPDLIRLSVGLENADDLIADLQQALDKI